MSESTRHPGQRALTPAVVVAALFTVVCAAIAITFVASRGGLQLPVAASRSHAQSPSPVLSAGPTAAAATIPPATLVPTVVPTSPPASPPGPTALPTPAATPAPTPAGSPDPLAALPGCPDHPGCYEYTVKRGDTLSGIASRFVIPLSTVRALNPDIGASGTIVVGEVVYLGREPYLRLDQCGDAVNCYLYVVQPGDGLSTIAARFGLTVQAILDANPQIPNANTIYSGQVIRLDYGHGVL